MTGGESSHKLKEEKVRAVGSARNIHLRRRSGLSEAYWEQKQMYLNMYD
jgi:hypothetical protein